MTKYDLSSFPPGSCRRFIVPKDEIAYRQATQLDPQDSIIRSALIYQYGQGIENRRLPRTTVFSYRFQPDIKLGLYASQNAWNAFWKAAYEESKKFRTILYSALQNALYKIPIFSMLATTNTEKILSISTQENR